MRPRFAHRWRRFSARRKKQFAYRDKARDRQYFVVKEQPQFVCSSTDMFDCAEQQAMNLLQRRPEVHDLDRDILRLTKKFNRSRTALDGLTLVMAQAPRASLAQIQMDEHPHGYHNKQARLMELIDFNDAIDATVLAMDDEHRRQFSERVKQAADRMCKRVGVPCFTNEQWNAIMRGLGREIAVYLAAKNSGFYAYMTSRTQDALGIDLQIQDPTTHRYINLDIKSPSAFRHRLEQLVKEGRLTEKGLLQADEKSYAVSMNGNNSHKVRIVILSTLPDKFGEVANFEFVDAGPMVDMLNFLIQNYGITDGKFGYIKEGRDG